MGQSLGIRVEDEDGATHSRKREQTKGEEQKTYLMILEEQRDLSENVGEIKMDRWPGGDLECQGKVNILRTCHSYYLASNL